MVRHIVSWNFKPELSEEERRAAAETLVARMTALRDLVPCVERLEVFQPPIGLSNWRPVHVHGDRQGGKSGGLPGPPGAPEGGRADPSVVL